MQLVFLLAVILAFSCLLNANGRPVTAPDVKLIGSLLAGGSLVAFAWWISQLKQHACSGGTPRWSAWAQRGERLYGFAYVAVVVLVYVAFDFAEIVHTNWQLRRFFLADDLVVSLSLAVPLSVSWLFLHTSTAEPFHRTSVVRRLDDVWLQTRHLIVLPLIPILVMAGIGDLHRFVVPGGSETGRVVLGGMSVLAIALTLPWLLRWCWPTRPLEPGPERAAIERTLADAKVGVTQILRWETHGQLANAAMTGFLPNLRYLFVTDELLRKLGSEDLRAITAHEAAHCRLGHLHRLAVSLAIPFFALLLGEQAMTSVTWLGASGTPLWALAVLCGWAHWHGRWSRLLEHQADVTACRLLSADGATVTTETARWFGHALRATGAKDAGDWLHPSPSDRVELLMDLAANSAAEERFERRVRRAYRSQWLLVGTLAATWLYFV